METREHTTYLNVYNLPYARRPHETIVAPDWNISEVGVIQFWSDHVALTADAFPADVATKAKVRADDLAGPPEILNSGIETEYTIVDAPLRDQYGVLIIDVEIHDEIGGEA